jgi:hypothetical protein
MATLEVLTYDIMDKLLDDADYSQNPPAWYNVIPESAGEMIVSKVCDLFNK